MLIRIVICVILLIIGHKLFAQERPVDDPEPAPNYSKTVSHYVGLQANQLIRQLISFGGNNSAVANPYTLTYAVNSKASGWGFATGIGYSSIQTKTSDVFVSTTSKIDDFAWRFGVEKKIYISRHWLTGIALDGLIESNKAESISNTGSSPNPTITTTEKRSGFGPRVLLNYQFHNRLMIGTEASFYFKWIKKEQKTTGTGQPTEPKADLRSFSFTPPAVLFLAMKF